MDVDTTQPIASSSSTPLPDIPNQIAASKNGRSMGKAHKALKTATRRTFISPAIKTPFEKRMEEEKKRKAVLALERDMKDEKEAERQMKRDKLKERRDREAEKKRMTELAAKMSAKKLQRLKKRQGRTKKING